MPASNRVANQIRHGMALAFFASAYADQAEECDQPLGGEIMEQLPATIDPSAVDAATTLEFQLISAHKYNDETASQDAKLCALWVRVESKSSADGDRTCTPELFGHYCAMQAMGTGVGLESFGYDAGEAITVPYVEFGSHSLEADYFQPIDDEGDEGDE